MKKADKNEIMQFLFEKPKNNVITSVNLDSEAFQFVTWVASESKTNRSYIVNCLIHEMMDSIEIEKKKNKKFDVKNILFSLNQAYYRVGHQNLNMIKKVV
jgi:hypothetical protein